MEGQNIKSKFRLEVCGRKNVKSKLWFEVCGRIHCGRTKCEIQILVGGMWGDLIFGWRYVGGQNKNLNSGWRYVGGHIVGGQNVKSKFWRYVGGHSAGSFPAAAAASPGNASYLLPENSWHAKIQLFAVVVFLNKYVLESVQQKVVDKQGQKFCLQIWKKKSSNRQYHLCQCTARLDKDTE